jgi:hypothetical protein
MILLGAISTNGCQWLCDAQGFVDSVGGTFPAMPPSVTCQRPTVNGENKVPRFLTVLMASFHAASSFVLVVKQKDATGH